ncbi:hypothetical protein [Novosphingobium sp.]|uniref:hypothetical protein n=1 Tax=Novosphingobium sp. TaxID=1874826 RepID=UPI00262DE94C|nr:hypothetical protein [Novosphingobium sp.]
MLWQRFICGLVVIYLGWRLSQGFIDFMKGRVLVRRALIWPRWQGLGRSETFTPYLFDRHDAPVTFWFWTVFQAIGLVVLIGLFAALSVSR